MGCCSGAGGFVLIHSVSHLVRTSLCLLLLYYEAWSWLFFQTSCWTRDQVCLVRLLRSHLLPAFLTPPPPMGLVEEKPVIGQQYM